MFSEEACVIEQPDDQNTEFDEGYYLKDESELSFNREERTITINSLKCQPRSLGFHQYMKGNSKTETYQSHNI